MLSVLVLVRTIVNVLPLIEKSAEAAIGWPLNELVEPASYQSRGAQPTLDCSHPHKPNSWFVRVSSRTQQIAPPGPGPTSTIDPPEQQREDNT
jgi:hypothetical protein